MSSSWRRARRGIVCCRCWAGAVTYTLQLYFDFSGYSDMAIGLGAMLGIRLPINFNRLIKPRTLPISGRVAIPADAARRFFNDLSIYLPLAVRSTRRKRVDAADDPTLESRVRVVLIPVLATFLWASGTAPAGNFVVFGLLHGIALCIFRGWRMAGMPAPPKPLAAATMLVVVAGMVLFRADSLGHRARDPARHGSRAGSSTGYAALPWIVALGAIALFAPNTQELMTAFPSASTRSSSLVAAAGGWNGETTRPAPSRQHWSFAIAAIDHPSIAIPLLPILKAH